MRNKREANPNWRGGRVVTQHRYVLLRVGVGHHLADVRGYAYEHRLVAEKMLGRRLRDGEEIHHRNGDTTDNRPENLEVLPSRAHHKMKHRSAASRRRGPDEPNPLITCGCGCGSTMLKFDGHGRPRRFVGAHRRRVERATASKPCACGCGAKIPAVDRWNRPRKYVLGHQRRAQETRKRE